MVASVTISGAVFANGQIPTSLLVDTRTPVGAFLEASAAASWQRVRADVFLRYGWWPAITSAGDAYRSEARQVTLFRERYTTSYLPGRPTRSWRGQVWWLRYGAASAAVPGTSNHGRADTIDVTGLIAYSATRWVQFARVAAKHGWSNTEGRAVDEFWHWRYFPSDDTHAPTTPLPVATVPAPASPMSKEDDMRDAIIAVYLNRVGRTPDPAALSYWLRAIALGEQTLSALDTMLANGPESAAFAALGSEAARDAKRNVNGGIWAGRGDD